MLEMQLMVWLRALESRLGRCGLRLKAERLPEPGASAGDSEKQTLTSYVRMSGIGRILPFGSSWAAYRTECVLSTQIGPSH